MSASLLEGRGKSGHQRAEYFLTGSSGDGEPAPQKQTAQHLLSELKYVSRESRCGVRVKW